MYYATLSIRKSSVTRIVTYNCTQYIVFQKVDRKKPRWVHSRIKAKSKSSHLGCSLTGGSTVVSRVNPSSKLETSVCEALHHVGKALVQQDGQRRWYQPVDPEEKWSIFQPRQDNRLHHVWKVKDFYYLNWTRHLVLWLRHPVEQLSERKLTIFHNTFSVYADEKTEINTEIAVTSIINNTVHTKSSSFVHADINKWFLCFP